MKQFLFFALLLMCLSGALFAQDNANLLKGRDAEIFKSAVNGEICRVYAKYIVKTATDPRGGETVKAFANSKSAVGKVACQTNTEPIISLTGTYSGKNGSIDDDITSTFDGVAGKYLFIDKMAEPFVGAVEIFDLTTGISVFKDEVYPTMSLVQKRFLDYENWSKKDGRLKNCPQAAKWKKGGLGVGWVQKHRFDLHSLKLTNGALRCEAAQ